MQRDNIPRGYYATPSKEMGWLSSFLSTKKQENQDTCD
jgi:hypothetical protein